MSRPRSYAARKFWLYLFATAGLSLHWRRRGTAASPIQSIYTRTHWLLQLLLGIGLGAPLGRYVSRSDEMVPARRRPRAIALASYIVAGALSNVPGVVVAVYRTHAFREAFPDIFPLTAAVVLAAT